MSKWERHGLEEKIVKILSEIEYKQNPEHHFGRPFLSAYQLAIEIGDRHPEVLADLGYQFGGLGTNENYSFVSYVSGQLSKKIKSGEINNIEGGFISNKHLDEISFNKSGEKVVSSLTNTQYDLSVYRLKKTSKSKVE